MKRILVLIGLLACTQVIAGPLDIKRGEARLKAIANGDVEALMTDYADDAYMDWVGGALDGRYRGKAAIREVWQKWVALNDGKPRTVKHGEVEEYASPKGVSVEAGAEYAGKTTVKIWHVWVYRDGRLDTEIWQVSPALKLEH